MGENVYALGRDGSSKRSKITKVFTYAGVVTTEETTAVAGDIVWPLRL